MGKVHFTMTEFQRLVENRHTIKSLMAHEIIIKTQVTQWILYDNMPLWPTHRCVTMGYTFTVISQMIEQNRLDRKKIMIAINNAFSWKRKFRAIPRYRYLANQVQDSGVRLFRCLRYASQIFLFSVGSCSGNTSPYTAAQTTPGISYAPPN